MKVAIVWICAVASLCGSIDGNVLRTDGDERRQPQIVDAHTNSADSENKIEENFETTTELEKMLESNVNRHRSTTRRTIDPEQVLAEIQKRITTTWRPRPQPSVSTRDEQFEPTPETTTEYKYKDLIKPYIIPQPYYVPMKHVAGTHYVKVDRGQNEHERVIEDYKKYFDRDSRPAQPDYAPPPKF
uniref:Putative conserved secreted protein n=1 Tax=Culex tarsalis TaxID=7177 RepID=A0A1Q3FM97_CULTA